MPQVSVIIPTHSRPPYLCEAVDSVLAQSLFDVEVIVVDDNGRGSDDQRQDEALLARYQNDPRVKYIVHESCKNGAAARNTGIRSAEGAYIAFLDDDDIFSPDKLEKQLHAMSAQNTDACLCGFTRFRPNKAVDTIPDIDKITIPALLSYKADTCAGSCLIVRKSLADDLHGFDESFERQQDLEFLIRVLNETAVAMVAEPLVRIRMHEQNLKTPDLQQTIRQRLHYVHTFDGIIRSFDKKTQREIYDSQYFVIATTAIKNRRPFQAIRWILKTHRSIKNFFKLCKRAGSYLFARKR